MTAHAKGRGTATPSGTEKRMHKGMMKENISDATFHTQDRVFLSDSQPTPSQLTTSQTLSRVTSCIVYILHAPYSSRAFGLKVVLEDMNDDFKLFT